MKKQPLLSSTSIKQFCNKVDAFKDLSKHLLPFKKAAFKNLPVSQQTLQVNQKLFKLIQTYKAPCFLLPAIVEYITKINQIFGEDFYHFSTFELWLNQFSQLNNEDNALVRAKISGKHLPRSEYQHLFPVGQGKSFLGSHFVTAHGAPDLDTVIASFWGWLDAFSARLSSGLHLWNLPPGGIYDSKEASPLTDVLGEDLFDALCLNQSGISPRAVDFITQQSIVKKQLKDSTFSYEDHERHKYAVMVVDKDGYYIGDLRSEDYESIRQILRLFSSMLNWLENTLQSQLIELFSKKEVHESAALKLISSIFHQSLASCFENQPLTNILEERLNQTLQELFGIEKGLQATFKEFGQGLKTQKVRGLSGLEKHLKDAFVKHRLFGTKGQLTKLRPNIFKAFQEISQGIESASSELIQFLGTMEIAIFIKRHVFDFPARYVTSESTIEEALDKAGPFSTLTVVEPEEDSRLWPLGIIHTKDLRSKHLGTVSLRDFCNRQEVSIDSSLEIISVMDHHKTDLKTSSAPFALLADAQSCNVLVAEQAFKINDLYSMGNLSPKKIEQGLKLALQSKNAQQELRLKKRWLERSLAARCASPYFIHPVREFVEYLSFVHAIIDDTDLFAKATQRDVICSMQLINRLLSLSSQKELEALNFDEASHGDQFVKEAVQMLVQNKDMYTIYQKIFEKRELDIKTSISETASGKSFALFADTKVQNGCANVGQSKVFKSNMQSLKRNYEKILCNWLNRAQDIYASHPQLDLHMQMMSTIPAAEEVHQGQPQSYSHRDALWIWVPDTPQAINRLSSFLNAFKAAPGIDNIDMQYQVLKSSPINYKELIKHHFMDIPAKKIVEVHKKMPVIILHFDAGTLNSRKAQITPFLPNVK